MDHAVTSAPRGRTVLRLLRIAAVGLALCLCVALGLRVYRAVMAREVAAQPRARVSVPERIRVAAEEGRLLNSGADASEYEAVSVALNNSERTANLPLQVDAMLPGDGESHIYSVRISHSKAVVLWLEVAETAAVGDSRLADMLETRLLNLADGSVLYSGSLSGLMAQGRVKLELPATGQQYTDVYYGLELYLPTSVDNGGQRLGTVFDLRWQADGSLLPPAPGSNDTPKTGVIEQTALYMALVLAAAIALLLLIARRRRGEETQRSVIGRQLRRQVLMLVILVLMLTGTTLALSATAAGVLGNYLYTMDVGVQLLGENRGANAPVFGDDDLLMEPGRSVIRPLVVRNASSIDIYYKLYLENVDHRLGDVMLFNIYDGDVLVKTVMITAFDENNALISDKPLAPGEEKLYRVEAVMRRTAGNRYQDESVTFDFKLVAVQAKNNQSRQF